MDRFYFEENMKENPFLTRQDLVYQYLLKKIIAMDYIPKMKVNESAIADELGISRTPVNSAINKLLKERFLVKKDHGVHVSPAKLSDYILICEARQMIEGTAAFYAATRITDF